MADLSSKTVLFVDDGLFFAFARRISPEFKKAFYYASWQEQFVKSNQLRLGDGFDEIERIKYPQDIEDEIDLFVFLDLFHADWQVRLAKQGRRVWGPRFGEEMELERWQFKDWMKRHDLEVPPSELIVGIDPLRDYLKDKQNKFIKLAHALPRGDMETWKWKSEDINARRLDQLKYDLGAFGDNYEFVVEDEIEDAVEIGYDGFSILGEYPDPSMMAYEVKGIGMIAAVKPYEQLAAPVKIINDVISPLLAAYDYRGFLCTEIRYTKDGEAFLIDPCTRLGSPSNELLQEMFTGWGRTFWDGAEGKLTSPEQVAKYGMIATVYSEQGGRNWQPLKYPKEIDQWVKPRNAFREKGVIYSVPQGEPHNIAAVVGIGDSIEEAIEACNEHASQLDGHLIEIGMDAAQKALRVIEEGEEYGIHFSDDLPTQEKVLEIMSAE